MSQPKDTYNFATWAECSVKVCNDCKHAEIKNKSNEVFDSLSQKYNLPKVQGALIMQNR